MVGGGCVPRRQMTRPRALRGPGRSSAPGSGVGSRFGPAVPLPSSAPLPPCFLGQTRGSVEFSF